MVIHQIEFRKLTIPEKYGQTIYNVYYVVENKRSKVMDNFYKLSQDEKDIIKDLICKMATIENFKSLKIKPALKGYNYGEIKPMPHRFFFFQTKGNNIIFFAYVLKKKDSLGNEFYRQLNKEKERYEREFERYI